MLTTFKLPIVLLALSSLASLSLGQNVDKIPPPIKKPFNPFCPTVVEQEQTKYEEWLNTIALEVSEIDALTIKISGPSIENDNIPLSQHRIRSVLRINKSGTAFAFNWDKSIYVIEVNTLNLLGQFEHSHSIVDMCFGRQEEELISSDENGNIVVWSLHTKSAVVRLDFIPPSTHLYRSVYNLRFNHEYDRLAFLCNNIIRIWDIKTNKQVSALSLLEAFKPTAEKLLDGFDYPEVYLGGKFWTFNNKFLLTPDNDHILLSFANSLYWFDSNTLKQKRKKRLFRYPREFGMGGYAYAKPPYGFDINALHLGQDNFSLAMLDTDSQFYSITDINNIRFDWPWKPLEGNPVNRLFSSELIIQEGKDFRDHNNYFLIDSANRTIGVLPFRKYSSQESVVFLRKPNSLLVQEFFFDDQGIRSEIKTFKLK